MTILHGHTIMEQGKMPDCSKGTLLWLDFETGGLDPKKSSPIEICIVETNLDGEVRNSFINRIKPVLPVSDGAAAVNGYTKEKWQYASELKDVAISVGKAGFLSGARWAGWNIPFDVGFWNEWFAPYVGLEVGYQQLDLFGMAWPWAKNLTKINLKNTYQYIMDEELKDAHSAQGDVMGCIRMYRRILEILDGLREAAILTARRVK